MAGSEQTVVELVVSLLETNLTDPLSRSKKWIYDDPARLDGSNYPRVAVTSITSGYELQGMCNTAQIEDQVIAIEVYVKKNQKIAGRRAEQIADDIHSEIKSIIKSNRQYFIDNGLLYLLPRDYQKSTISDIIVLRDTMLSQVVN